MEKEIEKDTKPPTKYKPSRNQQVRDTTTPDTNGCSNAVTVVDVGAMVKEENVLSTSDMNTAKTLVLLATTLVLFHNLNQNVQNGGTPKRKWTDEEDNLLKQHVNTVGPEKWSECAENIHGRRGKQCRERWHNHLAPNINKEEWTSEENIILLELHRQYGPQWALFEKFLPGRTANSIKNRFNSKYKKKTINA